MKEFCKCGHSKKTHVMDFDNTRCCACWQNDKLDHTGMCDCMAYVPEVKMNSAILEGDGQ